MNKIEQAIDILKSLKINPAEEDNICGIHNAIELLTEAGGMGPKNLTEDTYRLTCDLLIAEIISIEDNPEASIADLELAYEALTEVAQDGDESPQDTFDRVMKYVDNK